MKVLAVENNAELLKLLSHLLEKEGFETVTALAGQEGLDKFHSTKPDIVCLDILLEDISGIDICRRLRAENADLPILLITSKSHASDIKEGMAAGASEYIVKPFDLVSITALMLKVARGVLARQKAAALETFFDFGELRVYPVKLSVMRGESTIDLSLREAGLLKMFHDNRGKTVTTDAVAALCWKMQDTTNDKAVEWQIKQLRKKIEPDPANPILIVNDGAGYRFG